MLAANGWLQIYAEGATKQQNKQVIYGTVFKIC
jgi:hypothetical protein